MPRYYSKYAARPRRDALGRALCPTLSPEELAWCTLTVDHAGPHQARRPDGTPLETWKAE